MGKRLAIPLGFLRSDRLRWPLSLVAAAILWTLSLPPYGLGILAVLAFIPPLLALPEEAPGRVAAWGWAGGILWEFGTLWWLIPTMTRYGDISEPVALALVLGMCAILGLYMAGYLATMSWLVKRRGEWALVFAPCAWVLWEWLRGHLLSGMPWWGPGYALTLYPPLLQNVRFFGVLGLSFLAVLASAAIALWLRDRYHPVTQRAVPAAVLLLVAAFAGGMVQQGRPLSPKAQTPVGYLQPDIPQDQKWDTAFSEKTLKTTLDLTLALKNYGLQLILWPESSTPYQWDADQGFRDKVADAARQCRTSLLLGSVLSAGGAYQNGAVLVGPDGKEEARYAKTHLVPFGEYVPFRNWLFFARPIVDAIGDFQPGSSLLPLTTPAGKVGVTICFEGIFPGLVRKQVRDGAEVLVNMTNDAWYEGTPGPSQHFLLERVRAVETDRYLIRSANRGVCGVVDPRGRLEVTTTAGQPASFWGLVEPRRTRTLWTIMGNAWLLLPLLAVVAGLLPRRAREGSRRPL